jgi:hypothetical protein
MKSKHKLLLGTILLSLLASCQNGGNSSSSSKKKNGGNIEAPVEQQIDDIVEQVVTEKDIIEEEPKIDPKSLSSAERDEILASGANKFTELTGIKFDFIENYNSKIYSSVDVFVFLNELFKELEKSAKENTIDYSKVKNIKFEFITESDNPLHFDLGSKTLTLTKKANIEDTMAIVRNIPNVVNRINLHLKLQDKLKELSSLTQKEVTYCPEYVKQIPTIETVSRVINYAKKSDQNLYSLRAFDNIEFCNHSSISSELDIDVSMSMINNPLGLEEERFEKALQFGNLTKRAIKILGNSDINDIKFSIYDNFDAIDVSLSTLEYYIQEKPHELEGIDIISFFDRTNSSIYGTKMSRTLIIPDASVSLAEKKILELLVKHQVLP